MPAKSITRNGIVFQRPSPLCEAMVGTKFGRLTVKKYLGVKSIKGRTNHSHFLLCDCDCGGQHIANRSHLLNGGTTSCGCFRSELTTKRQTTHGFAPEKGKRKKSYSTWKSINSRCNNPNDSHFKSYGGRGIKVCERWTGPFGFANFLKDMGEPDDGLSIERMDVDRGYSPDNCCWIPWEDQSKNRRYNWRIMFKGEIIWGREIDRKIGRKRGFIVNRLKRLGFSKEDQIVLEEIPGILASEMEWRKMNKNLK